MAAEVGPVGSDEVCSPVPGGGGGGVAETGGGGVEPVGEGGGEPDGGGGVAVGVRARG